MSVFEGFSGDVKVTITGADDRVSVPDLVRLSERYPFVEWGILFSQTKTGLPRYPTQKWVEELLSFRSLHLSAHLCGGHARRMVGGLEGLVESEILTFFERFQINGYSPGDVFVVRRLADFQALSRAREVILQARGEAEFVETVRDACTIPRASVLFDASGGRGIEANGWPVHPKARVRAGYAGGISPLNVERVISQIYGRSWLAGSWIDMESGVRDADDQFDLKKVQQVLELVSEFLRGLST